MKNDATVLKNAPHVLFPERIESPLLVQQLPHVHHIELNLQDINQLFNTMDPSPFHQKDLDRDAEEFILSWVQEFNRGEPVWKSCPRGRTQNGSSKSQCTTTLTTEHG